MIPNKRLQVFISSTYSDLKEERQAAVLAILSSGHFPAGMELFSAGDQSQLEVIKDWINQSDIYLLILGGRYGSIEPSSGKSYIQLEFEYAVEKGKPVFSIILDEDRIEERVKEMGSIAIEKEHAAKYREFKKHVQTRMVKFWKDSKDIKLAIFETLNDFSKRDNLTGWVPGNQQIETSKLTSQLVKLGQENSKLHEIISNHQSEVKELRKKILSLEKVTKTIGYKNLNPKSSGFIQKAKINGEELSIQTSEYPDGTVGEIYINMPKESATVRALLESFAMSVSLGLQYGVPLDEFVDKFVSLKFDPSGLVEHPNVKATTSILDLVFRILGYEYLGRTDLVQILDKPEILNNGTDDWDEIPSNMLEYLKDSGFSTVKITPSNNLDNKE